MNRENIVGNVTGSVKWVLRAEALAVLILALSFYFQQGYSGLTFALYFLVPDLSFLGYLVNKKVGAMAYNGAHSLVGALGIVALGFFLNIELFQMAGLIWVSHIGVDRTLGYGLKYENGFGFTHLGLIGKEKKRNQKIVL